MANQLSPELLAQLFAQESPDPFLMLVTLDHEDLDEPIYLVNNTTNILSRGLTFMSFPMRIGLPADDGETARTVSIEFDNVSLDLINAFRTITSPAQVKLEMILSSIPDVVQIAIEDLEIQNIAYNKNNISATLVVDNFLNTELTSERYYPSNFPGLF